MWQIVHLGRNIVVAVANTRAEAYATKHSIQAITNERFKVSHA